MLSDCWPLGYPTVQSVQLGCSQAPDDVNHPMDPMVQERLKFLESLMGDNAELGKETFWADEKLKHGTVSDMVNGTHRYL